MRDCKHWEGDTVNGYWLCAKCYAKLPDRPFIIVKPTNLRGEDADTPYAQEIDKAPVAVAQGVSLSQFIEAMALRIVARTRGGFSKHDAMEYSVELLKSFETPFGADDMDWTTAGAWEMVDEDMQYWDCDSGGNS